MTRFASRRCDRLTERSRDRLEEAESFFSRARALQVDLAARFPSERQLRAELGLTYAMLASVHSKRGAHADALTWADQAVRHLDALRIELPGYSTVQNYLATAHFQRSCALVQLDRADEAVEALRLATTAGYDELQTLRTEPALEPLQKHPGFQRLLNELAASPGQ